MGLLGCGRHDDQSWAGRSLLGPHSVSPPWKPSCLRAAQPSLGHQQQQQHPSIWAPRLSPCPSGDLALPSYEVSVLGLNPGTVHP